MRTWRPRRPVVLIVDEDPDILHLLGMCLSAEGCEVREAISGADALTTLDRVDVLIVDQRMPNMCGTELIMTARAKGYTGRVLVISNSRTVRAETNLVPTDGFLAKPIGPRELIAEVERLFYLNVPLRPLDRAARISALPTKA